MLFFSRHQKTIQTPYGAARATGAHRSVNWRRWHGVRIDLCWPLESEPNQGLVEEIAKGLDGFIDAAIARLGISEFPEELRTVVPESVELLPTDEVGDWSLSFRCVEWEDGYWGAVFRGGKIIQVFSGD